MLRVIIILFGVLLLAAGFLTLHALPFAWPAAVELFLGGAIILFAVFFEARRYRAKVSAAGQWQPTGERFVDPTTGKLTEVRYNPKTGERKYEEIAPDAQSTQAN